MDTKFCTGLFEGDSVNGVKLSMGVTGGDFWARVAGCKNVYRGDSDGGTEGIDFSKVLAVCDIESNAVGVTGVVHEVNSSYLYAVRSVNCAGFEDQSLDALERVSFDAEGAVIGKTCNGVSDIRVERAKGSKVRISWLHCRINQQAECIKFCVYSNGGSGEIDYCNVIGSGKPDRKRVYTFQSGALAAGKWRFCIGAVSTGGYERMSSEIAIDINSATIGDTGNIKAKVI